MAWLNELEQDLVKAPEPSEEDIKANMFDMDFIREQKKGKNISGMRVNKKAQGDQLLPFKKVKIVGNIEGPIATLDIDLTYINPEA